MKLYLILIPICQDNELFYLRQSSSSLVTVMLNAEAGQQIKEVSQRILFYYFGGMENKERFITSMRHLQ